MACVSLRPDDEPPLEGFCGPDFLLLESETAEGGGPAAFCFTGACFADNLTDARTAPTLTPAE